MANAFVECDGAEVGMELYADGSGRVWNKTGLGRVHVGTSQTTTSSAGLAIMAVAPGAEGKFTEMMIQATPKLREWLAAREKKN